MLPVSTKIDSSLSLYQAVLLIITSILPLFYFSCADIRYQPTSHEPIIRVGIFEKKNTIEFIPQSSFNVSLKNSDKSFYFTHKGIWTVSIQQSQPASASFRILFSESDSPEIASESMQNIKKTDVEAEIEVIGESLKSGTNSIIDHRLYQVLLAKDFDTRQEAEAYLGTSSGLPNGRVIQKIAGPATGKLVLSSPQKKHVTLDDGFRITGANITLKQVEIGQGFHWNRKEDRTYSGEMEFQIDRDGKLTVINVLPLESYLLGVVQGEMPDSFPLEALKAQVVAARTFVLFNFSRQHRNDHFDVCDNVHCQSYVGISSISDKINRAVMDTRGIVLTYNGELCTTPYSAVCGGHTESAESAWSGDGKPYLKGVFDVASDKLNATSFDLTKEQNVKKWINSSPHVFCNVEWAGNPAYAVYAKKYFRWEQKFKRIELEKIINNNTGNNIGTLQDIIPVKRGSSGRIEELEIVGSLKSISIKKELNIRHTLSENTLYSSCFIIQKKGGNGTVADEFIFKGAGWGHGVGMCQVGASTMAAKGFDFSEILAHYYSHSKLKQLY